MLEAIPDTVREALGDGIHQAMDEAETHLQITALCKIAGAPELAAGFIGDRTVTVEQVRAKLLAKRVKADDTELQTQYLPLDASKGSGRLTTAVKKLLARRNKSAK